jgi:hypothetical protein
MLPMKFSQTNETRIGIIHPLAVTGEQRSHGGRFVRQDWHNAQNAAFDQGKNLAP